jgi:AcrR family transcriptional regulator
MIKNNQNTDRRIKRSKEALRKATFSLMKEKDFQSISITEIAERADFNRGTFYAHYQSKEDLLHEVVKEKMIELIDTLGISHKEKETITLEEMPAVAISLFTHFFNNAPYYQILLNHNVLPGFQGYLCETINEHFLKNVQAELVNPNHHIDPEINSYYTSYSILGMVVYWFKNDLKYTPDYMANQLIEIITNQIHKVTFSNSLKKDI